MVARWTLLIVAGVLAASAQAARADTALTLAVERYRLANGLRVVLAPDAELETASVVVHYGAGNADDPEGKEGLAHLVEHLMFDASPAFAGGQYAGWVARAGGYANAETDRDATSYWVDLPAGGIPTALWLESRRMAFASALADEQTLERERFILLDESRDLHCLRASSDAFVATAFFPEWHPYHRDDCTGNVLAVTLADVRAFAATWYQPSNATLAIVGPFDSSATRSLVERSFGRLSSVSPPERPPLPAEWSGQRVRLEVGVPAFQDSIMLIWRAPPLGTPDDLALDFVARLLGGSGGSLQAALGRTSRNPPMVGERSFRRDSMFVVSAGRENEDVDRMIAIVQRAVADLAADIKPAAWEATRRKMADDFLFRVETARGRASFFINTDTQIAVDPHASITAEDARRAAARYLLRPPALVVVTRSGKTFPPQGTILSRKIEPSP